MAALVRRSFLSIGVTWVRADLTAGLNRGYEHNVELNRDGSIISVENRSQAAL